MSHKRDDRSGKPVDPEADQAPANSSSASGEPPKRRRPAAPTAPTDPGAIANQETPASVQPVGSEPANVDSASASGPLSSTLRSAPPPPITQHKDGIRTALPPVKIPGAKRPNVPQPPQPPRAARPTLPELPETPPDSAQPQEAPPEEPVVMADDDAVIVPAPAPEALVSKKMVAELHRRHFVQTLAFKRTIIPPFLTLSLICLCIIVLAFASNSESPFYGLREAWFVAALAVLAVVFLSFAIMTMVQVKGELAQAGRQAH